MSLKYMTTLKASDFTAKFPLRAHFVLSIKQKHLVKELK